MCPITEAELCEREEHDDEPRRKGSKQSSRLSLKECGRNLLKLDNLFVIWYNFPVKSRRRYTGKVSVMNKKGLIGF
jgi:hypothetical protein